jgi:hypothetical protein
MFNQPLQTSPTMASVPLPTVSTVSTISTISTVSFAVNGTQESASVEINATVLNGASVLKAMEQCVTLYRAKHVNLEREPFHKAIHGCHEVYDDILASQYTHEEEQLTMEDAEDLMVCHQLVFHKGKHTIYMFSFNKMPIRFKCRDSIQYMKFQATSPITLYADAIQEVIRLYGQNANIKEIRLDVSNSMVVVDWHADCFDLSDVVTHCDFIVNVCST